MTALYWMPKPENFRFLVKTLEERPPSAWANAVSLAKHALNFTETNQLDEMMRRAIGDTVPRDLACRPVRLAILSSCTTTHLHSALRVAGLRRDMHVSVYACDYGQYWQELNNVESGLHIFEPNVLLFDLDAHHVARSVHSGMGREEVRQHLDEVLRHVDECWALARRCFPACSLIQTVPLPLHPPLLGNNEHRLLGSKAAFTASFNAALRPMADQAGIEVIAFDDRVSVDGLAFWYDAALWHRAKQGILASAAPLWGDFVIRSIAAKLGRSFKALVLDLDNTVWGGVIGDDGIGGIVLGQGSAMGEAFVDFQSYVRELRRRGVVLAVCSKNDIGNAAEPFDKHPDMILKRSDIACFVANWSDKAQNLRAIASELNIGLDSLVFADDNPFERNLVRAELPMVAVPEFSDDPSEYSRVLADAGYFEGVSVTDEDRQRTSQYIENRTRKALQATASDLPSYLRNLEMTLTWKRFDALSQQRVVQLINKTNQFNLTTNRYTEQEVEDVANDQSALGLHFRLVDRFGDNGIIAIFIARKFSDEDMFIDTWLMSCRVLGRQVENAMLNVVVEISRSLGATRLIGQYRPTKKNGMVENHYAQLGFSAIDVEADGSSSAALNLREFEARPAIMTIIEG